MNISIRVKLILIGSLFFLFTPSLIRAAEIKIVMPSNIGKNQVFPVQIFLDTQGELTVGTDLLFGFDQSDLSFEQVDEADFYSNYHEPMIFLDKSQIRFSGTSNYGEYEAGNKLFATFFFKKKKIGKPQLNLIWQEDKTNDTNVIGVGGEDLLKVSPVIEYDNSLRIKPDSKNEKPGKVLGGTDLFSEIVDETKNSGLILGKATVVEKDKSNQLRMILLLTILIVSFFLFFFWKRKKEK